MAKQNSYDPETAESSAPAADSLAEPDASALTASLFTLPASGTYSWPWPFPKEELRLDVDGRFPQMVASGTVRGGVGSRVNWIANLTPSGSNRWTGTIWFKDGPVVTFPYTNVEIKVDRSFLPGLQKAKVTFTGGWHRVRNYRYTSRYFHDVDFEFDFA